MIEYIVLLILIIVAVIYNNFKKHYQFWEELEIPYLEPTIPVGNIGEQLRSRIHFGWVIQKLYTKMKHHDNYCGIFFFRSPILLVLSPDFAKTVLVKDFQYFVDRGTYFNEKDDPLSANLFFLEGQRWKNLRSKLTPVFSTGKLKQMFLTFFDCGHKLQNYLKQSADSKENIDVREILACFSSDSVASFAFGIDTNSLENPKSDFREYGKKIMNFSKLKSLKIFLAMLFRKQAHALGIRFNDKDTTDFIMNLVRDTIDYRQKHIVIRNDFLQLLINMMENESNKSREGCMTFNEIAAQAFIFFFAGYETSSTTMSFVLYFLSIHQDIQDKARNVVQSTLDKYGGDWSYDALMEMTYIEQIIEETLRIYPPVATLHRIVSKDYQLENGKILKKGTGVLIPNLAFHHDPQYFPDPSKFDPDRFSLENKSNRNSFCYLPFAEGPRQCIGMRFGLLQTRLSIAMLLHKYKFNICDKTEIPVPTDPINLIYTAKNPIYLNISNV